MAYPVLVGSDVRAYVWYPNGVDGFPGAGAAVSMLGVYKSIKIMMDWTRANVKPSSQVYKEKRLTDFDWTATMEHQVRSGGPLVLEMLNAGVNNVIVQFQEESAGNYWTLYGGIQRGEYSVVNEERTENLTIENIGTIGNSGGSLFYSSGPVSIAQAASFVSSGATQIAYTAGVFH